MAITLSVGALWTQNSTGYVYEILALHPVILVSPIKTYSTTVPNASILLVPAEEFLVRFTEGGGAVIVPPATTLNALTTNSSSGTVGTPLTAAINGLTSGSTLTLTGAGAAGLSIAGGVINGTPTTAGTVNLVETFAGATNSPRTSAGVLTVSAATVAVARFASSYNSVAQASATRGVLGHANRWPHTMKTAQKRVRFAFAPWFLGSSSTGLATTIGNSQPIIGAFASCNNTVVPVLFGGSVSKTIDAAANAIEDIGSDWLTPEQFGFSGSFPANSLIWITFAVLRNSTSDASPSTLGRTTSDQSGSQTWHYDPTATTVVINNVGQMTSTGTAPTQLANGWMPWLIGEPVNASERVYFARGDSITQGIGDGTTASDGRGWFQIACSQMGVNNANFSVSGMTSMGGSTDPRITYWYQFANRGIVSTGTNDFGSGGATAVEDVQPRLTTIRNQMRAAGMGKVGGIKLLVRKSSTDSWATEENQSVGIFTGWVAGGNPDLFNQAQASQGWDFVIPFDSIRGVDVWKWRVNGVAKGFANDDTHPSNGGHAAMGAEAAPIMQTAG